MDALPDTVLAVVLEYSDLSTLRAIESTNRHLRHVVRAAGLWATLTRLHVMLSESDVPVDSTAWKRLMHVAARPFNSSTATALLLDVTACSSVDRPEEAAENTLTSSPCWQAIQSFPEWARASDDIFTSLATRVQYQCHCTLGIGCYWSSTPSANPAIQDFIEYTVAPQSLVSLLQVVPYRAFWHPSQPTYAPRAVSFQFYSVFSGTSTKNELLYESPVFPIENKMQLNGFKLSQPVWLSNGGIMRLNLHGRHQAQTVNMPMGPEGDVPYYYSCISFVNAQGTSPVRLGSTPAQAQF